jgi:hypothetical protein
MRVLRHDPGVPAVRDRQTGKPNTGKPDRVPDRMHDMAQFPRFEDALPAWRVQARLVPQAGRGAAPPGSRPHDPIASACLTWLAGHGCWPNQAADMRRVEAEVQAAIHQLVEPLPEQEPAWEIRSSAWAVPAAAGAAIGALIVSPLTWIWFDNRSIGLLLGATLGAYLAVRGLAALLDRPGLVSAMRSAVSLSGGGLVVGGVWRAIRGQSFGFFRSVMWLSVAPLLLTVVQSRLLALRSGGAADDRAGRRAEQSQVADLTLAVCWAHPDRLPPPAGAPPIGRDLLTGAIWAALSRLQPELAGGRSTQDLREAGEELFQRFQENGYEWQSIARGTPYAVEMAATFDVFGTVAPGQPVRTQRRAITRHGQVIHKGELRRA